MKTKRWVLSVVMAACAVSAEAAPVAPASRVGSDAITFARGGGFRMGPVGPGVGYRGGAYYGGWRRPYAWAPGGAIAAGAAIGVMSAAAAASYATMAAPADGMCWYYTDDSGTQGFWDVCQ
ncbi:MAG: hypothetical protein CTY15_08970 [Methylocystis sp.]|nr:MAG: hypothetical protein CTY15_08970 [Methylocystis sp.]